MVAVAVQRCAAGRQTLDGGRLWELALGDVSGQGWLGGLGQSDEGRIARPASEHLQPQNSFYCRTSSTLTSLPSRPNISAKSVQYELVS